MQTLRQETATAETGTFYFSDGGVGAVRKGAGRPGNPGGIQEESRGNPRRIQGESKENPGGIQGESRGNSGSRESEPRGVELR